MSETAQKTKETSETRKRRQLGPVAITGLVSVIIALMLLAFLTPAIHSGARHSFGRVSTGTCQGRIDAKDRGIWRIQGC